MKWLRILWLRFRANLFCAGRALKGEPWRGILVTLDSGTVVVGAVRCDGEKVIEQVKRIGVVPTSH